MTFSRAGKYRVTRYRVFSLNLGASILLAFLSTVCLAETYYLDPVAGNDSQSGTTQQLAWRSLSAVSSQSTVGDTIVLVNFDSTLGSTEWPDRVYQSTKIHQFGITWSFSQSHRVGQFANGDYWVVGPVSIVGISPASINDGARIRNGSMINPSPENDAQGYDNSMPYNKYEAGLNVALNVSGSDPLTLTNPCSLVSTQSVTNGGQKPQLLTAAVLTILDAPAPQGAFRPSYTGSDKTIHHTADDLDYSLLRSLTPVSGTPNLTTVADYFERPWLDHRGGWVARYQHPKYNMPEYGREMATQIGVGALMLHLDYSREQKAKLLHRYVQLGIDLHAIARNGGHWNWNNDGGHAGGRKWPILFAGLMLNDATMKSIGVKSGDYLYQGGYGPGNCPPDYIHFGEDDQTFYVSQADVDITNSSAFRPDSRDAQKIPYTAADIGLPEWGIRHSTHPEFSNKWLPTMYRGVAGPPFNGLALPALIMDARELWNHDAFFDYTDRFMAISAPGGEFEGFWRSQSTFTARMWDTYRTQFGPVWPDTESGHAPRLSFIGNRTLAAGETLTLEISATDTDGDALTYSASGLPTGASFSDSTFTWTPTADQAGDHQVTFQVTDGQHQDSETITITIGGGSSEPGNRAPVLSALGNRTTNENEALSFSISASDPDGDPITYSASGLPSGAVLSGQSFAWTPSYTQAGTYQVTFAASDGTDQDTETITITVTNVNRDPVLTSIGDQSVEEGNPLFLGIGATDPDGDDVIYSASGLPTGAALAGNSFSWTPTADQIGAHEVTFIVSDGTAQDSETITVYVIGGGVDHAAPTVARLNPEPDAIQVVLNNLITIHVTDSGKGVAADSVVIRVDGDIVYQGDVELYTSSTGRCHRSGAWNDYRFIYQPDHEFDFDHRVTVTVDASDRVGNAMAQYSYSFMTEMRAFGSNLPVSNDAQTVGSRNHPATVGDASGNVWATWHTGSEGSRRIHIATRSAKAKTFSAPTPLALSSADHCNPDIALGGDGQLYLVWQDKRRGNWDIFLSVSADGTTWSRAVQVTESDGNETVPSIAVDRQSPSRVYIAWQDDRNGSADIYTAHSTNVFTDSTVAQVTTNGADQIDPDIAVDGANIACVVWTDLRSGQADIYGASGALGWVNTPFVTTNSTQSSPALATELSGTALHLVWVDDAPGNSDIFYAVSEGLPSVPVAGVSIIDDSSGAQQLTPAIACLDARHVFACWQDRRNAVQDGDTDLYLTELGSGAAKTNILVGDDSSNSNQSDPALGLDEQGNPYIVWTDDRNAQTEIYYAATTFIDPSPLDSKLVVASEGATVGPDPATISEPDDVSIVVPAGACQCDVRITISEILNPLAMPAECLGSYDFGPSGIDFDVPVTVTIPYRFNGDSSSAKPYWYDSLTGALSQQGITDIKNIVIASDLNALQFKTTHFTPFYLVAGSDSSSAGTSSGGGGGGGGCSVSATGNGSPKELLVPYGLIALAMIGLRRRDKKRRQSLETARG